MAEKISNSYQEFSENKNCSAKTKSKAETVLVGVWSAMKLHTKQIKENVPKCQIIL